MGANNFISREVITVTAIPVAGDAQISDAPKSAEQPSITASPAAGEFLVAFVNGVAGEGAEAFVQRLSADGSQLPNGTDSRISTMGPPAAPAYGVSIDKTNAGFHPLMGRYVVTWAADHDLPGLVDNEFERYGQALDGAGTQVPDFDFRISFAGADGNSAVDASDGALAASTARRGWLQVWEGDDNRPPLADNEFEIYGRFIGDDFDLDGFAVPVDCNDGNRGHQSVRHRHPGQRHRRGLRRRRLDQLRPRRRRLAAPGGLQRQQPRSSGPAGATSRATGSTRTARDGTPRCSRAPAWRRSSRCSARSRASRGWWSSERSGACGSGSSARGRAAPSKLRRTKRFRVRRAGTRKLTGLVGGASLRPGAKLTVQLIENGAVGPPRRVQAAQRQGAQAAATRACGPGGTRTAALPALRLYGVLP